MQPSLRQLPEQVQRPGRPGRGALEAGRKQRHLWPHCHFEITVMFTPPPHHPTPPHAGEGCSKMATLVQLTCGCGYSGGSRVTLRPYFRQLISAVACDDVEKVDVT